MNTIININTFPNAGRKVHQGREIGHEYHLNFSQAAHSKNEVNMECKIQILIYKLKINV